MRNLDGWKGRPPQADKTKDIIYEDVVMMIERICITFHSLCGKSPGWWMDGGLVGKWMDGWMDAEKVDG